MNNMYKFIMTKHDTFTLKETFNMDRAQELILSKQIDDVDKKKLKKYIKCIDKNNYIKIQYSDRVGRLKSEVVEKNDDTCICQTYMSKAIKRNILNNIYNDVDIKNAHINIYIQLCNYYKLKCENIKYLHNEKLIEELKIDYNISNEEFKKIKCSILYGGTMKEELFIKIQNEIKENTKIILCNFNNIVYQVIEEHGDEYYNINGSALSLLIQQIEKQLIMNIKTFFINNNFEVGAIIHDGCHIKQKINNKILIECCEYIKKITPFEINLSIKEFKPDELIQDIFFINNEVEAGDVILKQLNNNLVFCNGRTFYNYENEYISNEKMIDKILLKYIFTQDIFMKGKDKDILLTKNVAPSKRILEVVKTNINIDETFYTKLWTSNLFKICYKNGYYDIKNKKFCKYDNDTLTPIKINRNYKPSTKKNRDIVMNKIFNPIFDNNKILIDYFLKCIARAVAGHTEDKSWFLMLGNRNCGKGVLVMAFEYAFEKYVGTTNSNNFLYKNNSGDEAKNLSWSIPLEFKRIIFTNEMKIDSAGETKIDGNMIKKLSSGGDKIQARLNHCDEIEFRPQASLIMMLNDVPKIEPADAMETCVEFNLPSQFVDIPQENSICKQYKKDDSIKTLLTENEFIDAFTDIIFNSYENIKPKMIEEIEKLKMENELESELNIFLSLFNFTYNEDDNITITKFNNIIKKSGITATAKKCKMWLRGKKIEQIRKTIEGKQVRVYPGLKIINNDTNNTINILDD